MEEAGSVGGEVEVESPALQIRAVAQVVLVTQEVIEAPLAGGQTRRVQRDIALAGVRREVYGHQVEFRRLRLPLRQDEIPGGGVLGPGGARNQEFALAAADGRGRQRRQEALVERLDCRLFRLCGLAAIGPASGFGRRRVGPGEGGASLADPG